MKTIKERAKAIIFEHESDIATAFSRAFALVQEIANAPEPEPVSDGHVYVHVSGLTGSGKSAVAGEIEIAMRAIGLDVEWVDSKSEKRLTHADYTSALELYRPKVRIFEKNIPRTAPPAFDHDAMDVFAANRFHVKPCDKRLFGWQVTAGDGEQTLYVGRKPDCENVARKLAGAFLDGAFYYSGLANAPNPPVLSDERILEIAMSDDVSLIEDQGPGVRPRITVHNSIGGVYAFARAIERELLGENE